MAHLYPGPLTVAWIALCATLFLFTSSWAFHSAVMLTIPCEEGIVLPTSKPWVSSGTAFYDILELLIPLVGKLYLQPSVDDMSTSICTFIVPVSIWGHLECNFWVISSLGFFYLLQTNECEDLQLPYGKWKELINWGTNVMISTSMGDFVTSLPCIRSGSPRYALPRFVK